MCNFRNNQLSKLFSNNRNWIEEMRQKNPDFFSTIAAQNKPKYMWIGCSDSRVPANQIIGLHPGEVFVHRNVGNVVVNSDLNVLSAVQFAVEHLKVEHIMLVGHFDCSGVKAAMNNTRIGLADNWLRHIMAIRDMHHELLDQIAPELRQAALTELNAIEQLIRLSKSTVVQDAWDKGQELYLHALVYSVSTGIISDLSVTLTSQEQIKMQREKALKLVAERYLGTNFPDSSSQLNDHATNTKLNSGT